jgi:hypothetical protein
MAQIIEYRHEACKPPVGGVCHVGSEQALGGAQLAEYHAPWPQWGSFTVTPAPAHGDPDPTAPGAPRYLLGKPSLTDSGRPTDYRHLSMALTRGFQDLH